MTIDPRVDIGHVHLKVADLDRALAFWRDTLGFEEQARMGDQAAFLSAGGYHHHIGLNTWESQGGSPPPRGTTGPLPRRRSLPRPEVAGDDPEAVAGSGDPVRGRVRPRRERGDLPPRSRRERRRALLRPSARAVAARGRRHGRDVHAATRSSPPCSPKPSRLALRDIHAASLRRQLYLGHSEDEACRATGTGRDPLRRRLRRRHAADRGPLHERDRDLRQRPRDPARLPGRDPRACGVAARRVRLPGALRRSRHPDAG